MYENIKYKSKYVGVGFEKQQTAQTLRIWKEKCTYILLFSAKQALYSSHLKGLHLLIYIDFARRCVDNRIMLLVFSELKD